MKNLLWGRNKRVSLFHTAAAISVSVVITAGVYAHEPAGTGKGAKRLKESVKAEVQERYGKLPLYFIENQGQMDRKVRFYEKGSGHALFFTGKEIYLSMKGRRQDDAGNGKQQSEVVRFMALGAQSHPEIAAEGLQEGKVNYLIGNDPEKWKRNIPTYQAVLYKDIYRGVDMRFYGNNRQLEYDIIVKPGTNPSRIQFLYQGIEDLRVTENGDLEINLKEGKFIQKKPYVYQEIEGKRVEVEG